MLTFVSLFRLRLMRRFPASFHWGLDDLPTYSLIDAS